MTLKGKVRQKQTEIIANMEDVNISSAAALHISTATGWKVMTSPHKDRYTTNGLPKEARDNEMY